MDLNALERATSRAFTRMAGPAEPAPVQLYQRLKPSDFVDMIKKYGEDDVLNYIKRMEAELVKGNQNGSSS